MRHNALNSSVNSVRFLSELRCGTRINYQIPLTLKSLDPAHPFSEPGRTLLVNPQGCAARFGRPLEIGAAVEIASLPGRTHVTARVVNCIQIKSYPSFWLLGLSLDKPGNVWGVESPPEDWSPKTEQH